MLPGALLFNSNAKPEIQKYLANRDGHNNGKSCRLARQLRTPRLVGVLSKKP